MQISDTLQDAVICRKLAATLSKTSKCKNEEKKTHDGISDHLCGSSRRTDRDSYVSICAASHVHAFTRTLDLGSGNVGKHVTEAAGWLRKKEKEETIKLVPFHALISSFNFIVTRKPKFITVMSFFSGACEPRMVTCTMHNVHMKWARSRIPLPGPGKQELSAKECREPFRGP